MAKRFAWDTTGFMGNRVRAEGPQHEVEITKPFYLGVYEVTQEQYERVMGKTPSHFSVAGGGKTLVLGLETSKFPVDSVTWEEAVEFCQKLSERPEEKKANRMYRLPTEAEWEYSCRGGVSTYQPFHTGAVLTSTQANFGGTLGRPCEVGYYPSNQLGVHDIHGNVLEWCSDFFDEDYYNSSPTKDPCKSDWKDIERPRRVKRGGNWYLSVQSCRSAMRHDGSPTFRSFHVGFRVVMVTSGQEQKPRTVHPPAGRPRMDLKQQAPEKPEKKEEEKAIPKQPSESPLVRARLFRSSKAEGGQSFRAAALRLPYVYVLDRAPKDYSMADLVVFRVPTEPEKRVGAKELLRIPKAGEKGHLLLLKDILICTRKGGLEVYSLEDPVKPRHLGRFGPEKLYETTSILRKDNIVYLLSRTSIPIFDISNPASPRFVKSVDTSANVWCGCISEKYLYLGTRESSLQGQLGKVPGIIVYDIADPHNPNRCGFIETWESPYHLFPCQGNLLVVYSNKTQFMDLKDPEKPAPLGRPVSHSTLRASVLLRKQSTDYFVGGGAARAVRGTDFQQMGRFSTVVPGEKGVWDAFPYHGDTEGDHVVIPHNHVVVVLRISPSPN